MKTAAFLALAIGLAARTWRRASVASTSARACLYAIDYTTYARTATEGGDVFGAIAKARTITSAQRGRYGGTGPMSPEAGFPATPFCAKIAAP